MNDDEFLQALENCSLQPAEFDHYAHVRAAYLYLQKHEFAVAVDRIRSCIRNYAAHIAKPLLYHETMTVAYMSLIQQRRHEGGDRGNWLSFARANPELFVRNLLRQFYSEAELQSETARHIFLLPRHLSTSFAPRRT